MAKARRAEFRENPTRELVSWATRTWAAGSLVLRPKAQVSLALQSMTLASEALQKTARVCMAKARRAVFQGDPTMEQVSRAIRTWALGFLVFRPRARASSALPEMVMACKLLRIPARVCMAKAHRGVSWGIPLQTLACLAF